MALENQLEALCFVRSPRATRASRATNPRPSGLVALDLAESRQSYCTFAVLHSVESRQSYSRRSRCWQNYDVTARCCHLMVHASGGRR